jgi:hypothetical protein
MKKLALMSLLLVAGAVSAAPKKEAVKETKKDPMMEEMAAAEKAQKPGPEHEKLKALVGTWDVTMKMYNPMKPTAPPMEQKGGVAKYELILDGRYLAEDFSSSFMGKPFAGRGLNGYDNLKKKYVWTWVDTMSTGVFVSEGTADATGKVITTTAEELDHHGKKHAIRSVTTTNSDKQRTMEMFKTGDDGKEVKTMELVYTRK